MTDEIENAIDDLKDLFENYIDNEFGDQEYAMLQSHLNYIGELADNLDNG